MEVNDVERIKGAMFTLLLLIQLFQQPYLRGNEKALDCVLLNNIKMPLTHTHFDETQNTGNYR